MAPPPSKPSTRARRGKEREIMDLRWVRSGRDK
jgi:hypothetical protein